MQIIKMFSSRPANTLSWFNVFIFLLPHPYKEPVDLECEIGLLGKSLIMSEQSDPVAKYCVEIKCPNTHFTGMHVLTSDYKMRLHVMCFILYHSFTITLYFRGNNYDVTKLLGHPVNVPPDASRLPLCCHGVFTGKGHCWHDKSCYHQNYIKP